MITVLSKLEAAQVRIVEQGNVRLQLAALAVF